MIPRKYSDMIGGSVVVRDYDDMRLEYGEESYFGISPDGSSSYSFINSMRDLCGKTYVVRNVREPYEGEGVRELVFELEDENGKLPYSFHRWMLEDDVEKTFEPEYPVEYLFS